MNDGGLGTHKLKLLEDVYVTRRQLRLHGGELNVLRALFELYRGDTLVGERLLIFPSQAALIQASFGRKPCTIRRHLATLERRGLIVRNRAAANSGAKIVDGLDLAPVVAQAAELAQLAEANWTKWRAEKKAAQRRAGAQRRRRNRGRSRQSQSPRKQGAI